MSTRQVSTSDSKPLTVLLMPDYRGVNPYQQLLADALEQQGVQVRFARGYRRFVPIFRCIREQSSAVDVLHLHWPDPYVKGHSLAVRTVYTVKFTLDLLLVRLCGVRMVWTVHNRVAHEAKYKRLYNLLSRILARLSDRILVHSRSARREVEEAFAISNQKIDSIAHGHYRSLYPATLSKAEARSNLEIVSTGRVYLSFGMLRPYKGIEQLLQCWAGHVNQHPNDVLIIAGQPLSDAYLSELRVTASQLPGIRLVPEFISEERLPVFLGAADVAVFCFRKSFTSGSVILAMSFGCPVLAPRVGNIPEVLPHAGDLLYDPEDPAALAAALKKSTQVSLESLRARTAADCDQLDWGPIAARHYSAYRNCFDQSREQSGREPVEVSNKPQ